jgi:hypothetical protein
MFSYKDEFVIVSQSFKCLLVRSTSCKASAVNNITVTMKNITLLGCFTVLFVFTGALEIRQMHHVISTDKAIEKFTLTELPVNSSSRYGRTYTGDSYLDEVHTSCLNTKSIFSCFKYKALRYLQKVASPSADNTLVPDSEGLPMVGSMVRLVSIPESMAASKEFVKTLFPDSQPRSSDSELERLYKFTLRQAERFARSHALALRIPTQSATNGYTGAAQSPRIVDEDHPENDLQDDNAISGRPNGCKTRPTLYSVSNRKMEVKWPVHLSTMTQEAWSSGR